MMIPTLNRVESLTNVVSEILCQNVPATSILICDSSNQAIHDSLVRQINELGTSQIKVLHTQIQSSALQRNLLLEEWLESHRDCTYGLFIDDDTVPRRDYACRLMTLLEINGLVGGVSGVTRTAQYNSKPTRMFERFLLKCFQLDGSPGTLLRSGINVGPSPTWSTPQEVEWLFGCSMWRRSAVLGTRFPETWMGYAIGEDVYFSTQVSRSWVLVTDPSAHLIIDQAGASSSRRETFKFEVIHRFQIVRDRPHRRNSDFLLYSWSIFGVLLLSGFAYLRTRRQIFLERVLGTWNGSLTLLKFLLKGVSIEE